MPSEPLSLYRTLSDYTDGRLNAAALPPIFQSLSREDVSCVIVAFQHDPSAEAVVARRFLPLQGKLFDALEAEASELEAKSKEGEAEATEDARQEEARLVSFGFTPLQRRLFLALESELDSSSDGSLEEREIVEIVYGPTEDDRDRKKLSEIEAQCRSRRAQRAARLAWTPPSRDEVLARYLPRLRALVHSFNTCCQEHHNTFQIVRPEPGYLKLIDSSKPNEDDEDDEFVQTPAQAQRVGDILRGLPPDLKKYIMEGPPKTAFSRRGQQELLNQCIKRIRSLFRKCRTIPSGDLKDKCKDFPFHTFTRACKQLGVIKRRIGGLGSKGQWVAEMPKRGTKADISARPAP